MRYQLFKSPKTLKMPIVDSKYKEFDIANFNVLSLPGACVGHIVLCRNRRVTILLVVSLEVTIYYRNALPRNLQIQRKSYQILLFCCFCTWYTLPQRSKTVNALLASRKEGWKDRGLSHIFTATNT